MIFYSMHNGDIIVVLAARGFRILLM